MGQSINPRGDPMSGSTASQIIAARADRLLHEFHHGDFVKMALGGPDIMKNMPHIWTGAWQDLPGHPRRDVAMWRHPTDPLASSVWARPGYDPYRKAFLDFLAAVHGLRGGALPPGTDVDHLQARSTVPAGSFIRLEAVTASSNRSHGAGEEKRMAGSTVTEGRKARGHTPGTMTWLVALKLAGLLSPRISNAAAQADRMDAAITFFTSRGWPRPVVEQGLDGLFEVADRR